MRKRQRPWQNVIWWEWCNCADKEYAKHLFNLVANNPLGCRTTIFTALVGALYGAEVGLLLSLIIANWHELLSLMITKLLIAMNWHVWDKPALTWTVSQPLILSCSGIGMVIGLLGRLLVGQALTWQEWWSWLNFHTSSGPVPRALVPADICPLLRVVVTRVEDLIECSIDCIVEELDAWKWDDYPLDHALSVSKEWVLKGFMFSWALFMLSLFLLPFLADIIQGRYSSSGTIQVVTNAIGGKYGSIMAVLTTVVALLACSPIVLSLLYILLIVAGPISGVVKLGVLLGLILVLVCLVVSLLVCGPLVVSIARAVGWLEFSF